MLLFYVLHIGGARYGLELPCEFKFQGDKFSCDWLKEKLKTCPCALTRDVRLREVKNVVFERRNHWDRSLASANGKCLLTIPQPSLRSWRPLPCLDHGSATKT